MSLTPHDSRWRRSSSNSSGKRRVVGDDVDRVAVAGDRGGDRLVVADVIGDHDHRPAGRAPERPRRAPRRLPSTWSASSSAGRDGQAHQLDHVARVLAIRAQGEPAGRGDRPGAGRGRDRSWRWRSAASTATRGSSPARRCAITLRDRHAAARGRALPPPPDSRTPPRARRAAAAWTQGAGAAPRAGVRSWSSGPRPGDPDAPGAMITGRGGRLLLGLAGERLGVLLGLLACPPGSRCPRRG